MQLFVSYVCKKNYIATPFKNIIINSVSIKDKEDKSWNNKKIYNATPFKNIFFSKKFKEGETSAPNFIKIYQKKHFKVHQTTFKKINSASVLG